MALALAGTLGLAAPALSQSPGETQVTVYKNEYAPKLKDVKVRLGNEVLFDDAKYTDLIRGKRVGLITNPSGMDSSFVSTIDKLAFSGVCKLTGLFGPEHGIRGDADAGEHVKSSVDEKTSTPVHSLYGTDEQGRRRAIPSPEIMETVDVMVYDLQDIGNRSYTYVTTMKNCMKAAAESKKPFLVLDRPNPMGGNFVDGNVLDKEFESTVGWAPVPYLYGMTCGETALWMKDYLGLTDLELHVVPMKGWKREMKWMDTGLPWTPTSTHMPQPETCWYIALTGTFGELHSLNEGVGYTAPFQYVGAPFIKSQELADELNKRQLAGVFFRPVYYRPFYGRFKTEMCGGVHVMITDYDTVQPVEAGIHVLEAVNKLYPEQDILHANDPSSTQTARISMFNKVMGTDKVQKDLAAGKPATEVMANWKSEREQFVADNRKYFLYE